MSAGVELFCVPPDQIEIAWPEIERHISRVEDIDPQDVKADLLSCKAQAWGLRDSHVLGFWITRVELRRGRKYGVVWACAGDLIKAGLIDTYRSVVEPWFWSEGCEWIEIHGRKGWKKLIPDYCERSVVLEKRRVPA